MNIKNEEAHRLAQELAKLTGETLTEAVTVALRERLSRLVPDQATDADRRIARLKELMRVTAPLAAALPASTDIGDLLYDAETGLPK